MSNATVITKSEAVNIISRNVKGTTTITIDMDSPMDGKGKMRKTGNPFVGKGIIKRVTMNGMIGFDYENSVNRQATREDKEHRGAKPRTWGTLTPDRLFVEHKGQYYLQMKVQKASTPVYMYPDGTILETSEIKPFIPIKKKSSTQSDIDKEVIVRDVKMENITGMRFNNGKYILDNESTPLIEQVKTSGTTKTTEREKRPKIRKSGLPAKDNHYLAWLERRLLSKQEICSCN